MKAYDDILQKPERERKRLALLFASTLTIFIFVGFAMYKGIFGFSKHNSIAVNPEVNEAAVAKVQTPIQNSKQTFGGAYQDLYNQYRAFKNSMANVFVPFVTGIDVYKR